MTPFDWPTPKTSSMVQKSGTYLKYELSCGEFCVKFCNATGKGLSIKDVRTEGGSGVKPNGDRSGQGGGGFQ